MIKDYIIVFLFSILVVFGITVSIKCKHLQEENLLLKNDMSVISTIKIENKTLEHQIDCLTEDLEYYKHQVDSLNKVKQRVIIKQSYTVSNNITKSVALLKKNLQCEK